MSKTPDEIKKIIEEWIKITGVKYDDITLSQSPNQPNLEWALKFADFIIIYMIKGRPDRIVMDCPIGFAEEHRIATSQMEDIEFLKFANEINQLLLTADLSVNYDQDQKMIKQITIQSYIDTESLMREKFYRMLDKIGGFKGVIVQKVQIKFGIKGQLTNLDQSSSKKHFYG